MKKLILLLCLFSAVAHAQEKCLSEILFREESKNDPSMLQERQRLEEFTQSWISQNDGNTNRSSTATATYIIPVVFHVIHKGGTENISDAQIYNQLVIINRDYQRKNPDTVDTYAPFIPLAANCSIEFRLAQKDPNGNCTTGINRIYSPLTDNARNNVKSLIDWPRNQYLNVWVVNSIENSSGIAGNVLGFASFPGPNASLDGIVARADYIGNIGTALNHAGRVLTHEAGHWLNLIHIWGDEPACAQDDNVSDTPLQGTYTFSICPNAPYHDACQPSGNGIMFQNYMDYTAYSCMNLFTNGQSNRMHAALNSNTGERNSVWSPGNLASTGTDGTPSVLCAPVADFIPRTKFACVGSPVSFKDISWGGADTARLWSFPLGTPASDTSAKPTVTYSAPGQYDVSLTAYNSAGSNTKTLYNHVIVSPNTASQPFPFSEDFENGTFPFNDWYIINDNGSSQWELTSIAAASGLNSLTVDNITGGQKGPDEFIMPSLDFTNVTSATFTFKLAFAFKSALANNDKLDVYSSSDCGATWVLRKTFSGTTLATTTNYFTAAYIPAPADWATKTVNINNPNFFGKPNLRFRFQFTEDNGNNIYIDDINITGVVDVNEALAQKTNLNIYPNPSQDHTFISFNTEEDYKARIEITDVTGRMINSISENVKAGAHKIKLENNLEQGVYFIRLYLDNHTFVKKVVMD